MRETIFWRIIIIKQILWSKKKHKIENEVEYAKLGSWESYTSSFVSISFFFWFGFFRWLITLWSSTHFHVSMRASLHQRTFYVFSFQFCIYFLILLLGDYHFGIEKRKKKLFIAIEIYRCGRLFFEEVYWSKKIGSNNKQ